MNSKKLLVVEQYVSWPGHYRKYFCNLISEKYHYLYSAEDKLSIPNSTFLQAKYATTQNHSFINFIKGRFFDSKNAYSEMLEKHADVIHLVEFEPLSFFFLLLFKSKNLPKLIITVHSIERLQYASAIKNGISALQRILYRYTLRKCARLGATFVNHYQHHKNQLTEVLGDNYSGDIRVINYPCPRARARPAKIKDVSGKLLIYGSIRDDKGIYEFLSSPGAEKLNITIAGTIFDKRILSLVYPNLKILNKYFNEEEQELKDLISSHDFMLLPYLKTYSGGSGTFKDSISFGLPIIASDIPTFREVINEGGVGFIYENIDDILNYATNTTEAKYSLLCSNCYNYASKYNWDYMKSEYFKIYDQCLDQVL